MSALIIISAAIFLVYMVAIIVRYGFPASVSDSFYLLPLKWNAAFTLFCVSVAMTLLPAWLEKSPGPRFSRARDWRSSVWPRSSGMIL